MRISHIINKLFIKNIGTLAVVIFPSLKNANYFVNGLLTGISGKEN